MNKEVGRIGVVTTTQYPEWKPFPNDPMESESQVRGSLALSMIYESRSSGFPTVVIDSELSSPEFREELEFHKFPTIERSIKSLSGQRREAISAIRESDVDVILLNDPEKVSIITDCMDECVEPILNGEADIVIPERDPELFKATYPESQLKYETKHNLILNRALRKAGIMNDTHPDYDWFIGIRFMANSPEITDLFLKEYRYTDERIINNPDLLRLLNLEMWPNGQYIPVIEALNRGLKVKSVPVPYRHPESQTQFELNNNRDYTQKRINQGKNIVVSSVQAIRLFENKHKSIIERVSK